MTLFAATDNGKPIPKLTICALGLGYVGIPLAEAFARPPAYVRV